MVIYYITIRWLEAVTNKRIKKLRFLAEQSPVEWDIINDKIIKITKAIKSRYSNNEYKVRHSLARGK